MTAEQVERIVRLALDFGEAHIADYDLSIKLDADQVKRFSEWIAENDPSSYREWERAVVADAKQV